MDLILESLTTLVLCPIAGTKYFSKELPSPVKSNQKFNAAGLVSTFLFQYLLMPSPEL
jgi:hypothetical protein